jgi:hypothetical protein
MSNSICPSDPCPVVFNGMIIYRDDHHMTATFAAAIAGDLLEALPPLAAPPSPSPTPPIGAPMPNEPVPTAEAPSPPPAIEASPTPIPATGP